MKRHTLTDDEASLVTSALRIYADIQKWEMISDCGTAANELSQRINTTQHSEPVASNPSYGRGGLLGRCDMKRTEICPDDKHVWIAHWTSDDDWAECDVCHEIEEQSNVDCENV